MLTARKALQISRQFSNKYLLAALAQIKKAAEDGKTSIIVQFNKQTKDDKDPGFHADARKNLIEALRDLGFEVPWDGEVSQKFAPDYKNYRIQIDWKNIKETEEQIAESAALDNAKIELTKEGIEVEEIEYKDYIKEKFPNPKHRENIKATSQKG